MCEDVTRVTIEIKVPVDFEVDKLAFAAQRNWDLNINLPGWKFTGSSVSAELTDVSSRYYKILVISADVDAISHYLDMAVRS